jgi:hypothetical protein
MPTHCVNGTSFHTDNKVTSTNNLWHIGFEDLTVESMKMVVFRVVALCGLVEGHECFRSICCLPYGKSMVVEVMHVVIRMKCKWVGKHDSVVPLKIRTPGTHTSC